MKLTEEQQRIVEENYKLIFWYANMKHLNLEEWYDLLAIELCYAVMKHKVEKGSLSTYFKLRADGLVYKESKKARTLKRTCTEVGFIENIHSNRETTDELLELEEWVGVENKDIIRMKYDGYTQTEIAREIGVSQSYVSKVLRKTKEDYYSDR